MELSPQGGEAAFLLAKVWSKHAGLLEDTEEAEDQIAFADVVLLNKTDLEEHTSGTRT